jgi:hypothetical protein
VGGDLGRTGTGTAVGGDLGGTGAGLPGRDPRI